MKARKFAGRTDSPDNARSKHRLAAARQLLLRHLASPAFALLRLRVIVVDGWGVTHGISVSFTTGASHYSASHGAGAGSMCTDGTHFTGGCISTSTKPEACNSPVRHRRGRAAAADNGRRRVRRGGKRRHGAATSVTTMMKYKVWLQAKGSRSDCIMKTLILHANSPFLKRQLVLAFPPCRPLPS